MADYEGQVVTLTSTNEASAHHEVLEAIWRFIRRIDSIDSFEAFVYQREAELESIFGGDGVLDLLSVNFKSADADALRCDMKAAIAQIPLACECAKIRPAQEVDVAFLPVLRDTEAVLNYVDGVLSSMDQLGNDQTAQGYWTPTSGQDAGATHFFQAPQLRKCRICGSQWMAVLNESSVSWLLREINPALLQPVSPGWSLPLIADSFNYQRVENAVDDKDP